MTDYANQPLSVTEARAMRSDDASDWTARDALIALLRDIDAGKEDARNLVIVYDKPVSKGSSTRFLMAGSGIQQSLGMLEIAKYQMLISGDDG